MEGYANDVSIRKRNYGKVPYSLLVHSSSNLNMETHISQSDYEPGATIRVSVRLSQYGIPLNTNCSVTTEMTLPNKQVKTLQLEKVGEGMYERKIIADSSGIYQFLTKAKGFSLRGKEFSREQLRNASVWRGGNQPSPGNRGTGIPNSSKEELCKLISCLLSSKNISNDLKEKLLKQGINIEGMMRCLKEYCKASSPAQLNYTEISNLKLNYELLLKSFEDVLKK